MPRVSVFLGLVLGLAACTLQHSKQALSPELPAATPPPDARFVTEEDSGLSILGVFTLAEPDHYAVLFERLRRDQRCARLSYPQLDFYTDHWLLIAFPISRITALCEPERADVIPALAPDAAGAAPAAPPTAPPPTDAGAAPPPASPP